MCTVSRSPVENLTLEVLAGDVRSKPAIKQPPKYWGEQPNHKKHGDQDVVLHGVKFSNKFQWKDSFDFGGWAMIGKRDTLLGYKPQ